MDLSFIEKLQKIELNQDLCLNQTHENLSDDEDLLAELQALGQENEADTENKSISYVENEKNVLQLIEPTDSTKLKHFQTNQTLINSRGNLIDLKNTTDNLNLNNFDEILDKSLFNIVKNSTDNQIDYVTKSDNFNEEIKIDKKENDLTLSLSNQALSILERRRAAYLKNIKIAKKANDRSNAIQFLDVVKQFDGAIEAVKNCAEISIEDIEQIPPSPPPYHPNLKSENLMEELEKRCNSYQQLVQKFKADNQLSRARMNERQLNQYIEAIQKLKKNMFIDVKALPIPPGFEELPDKFIVEVKAIQHEQKLSTNIKKLNEKATPSMELKQFVDSTQNFQLQLVLFRQNEFKRAALCEKRNGELNTAKILLNKAKTLNQMIEAAQCGLNINIKNIPIPSITPPKKVLTSNDKINVLFRELIKQLQLADELRKRFQYINDAQSTLFYDKLLSKCLLDLEFLSQCDKQMPRYEIIKRNCPVLNINNDVPDNSLDLKIECIHKLSVSGSGIFVTYNFPFPHNAHQTGKTAVVKSDKPDFNEVFRLFINRKLEQKIIRIIKRIPLKLEIYQKGGFLRSDKLLGQGNVMLSELEHMSTLTKSVEILQGRQPSGQTISLKIEISKPLSSSCAKNTTMIEKKWVELV